MKVTIELDLPSIIGAAISAERIQPLVDKAMSSAISDAINDATGYSSDFRKELKRQLAAAMPHGLEIEDCAKFSQMFNLAISEAVQGANAQSIQAAMRKALEHVIPDVPERIKLSEFLDDARVGFHKEKHEAFYAHLELSPYGGGWLYLDSNASCDGKYSAAQSISFTEKGDVYAVKLDGRELTPKALPSAIGNFKGLLLAMYVGRLSLEIDCDEGDVESAAAEQYD